MSICNLSIRSNRFRTVTARLWAVSLFVSITALPAAARESADAVSVKVETQQTGPTISRHIFGQFAEHLGRGIYGGLWVGPDSKIPNTRGIRNDVVNALKELHVPNVRWPGGCFADEYHWRKGLGPTDQRPATLNPNWGGVIEPNTFGTHEFMDLLEQIGADAYLSVNVGSGTPQEASEWLEYMTTPQSTALAKERAKNGHPAPYKVAFVGLGNESWGCGGSMTPDYYVSQMKIYSRYVRNFNDAVTTQKIAVGPDGADTGYTEAVMKAQQGHNWAWNIDGLSLHSYTVGQWPPSYKATGFGEDEYASLLKATLRMEDLVRAHSEIMDRYDPDKKVALVVDEWGAWLAPTPGTNKDFLEQQNSQRDAIIAALNLNTFAKHAARVRMANIAQMINVLQAMIFTDNDKMILTPTYHVFHMYVPFQDSTFIPVAFDAGSYKHGDVTLPRVDAIAARNKQKQLWVAVTNVDPTAATTIRLSLDQGKFTGATGQVLSAPKLDSVNTFAAPNTVVPKAITAKKQGNELVINLPAASVAVLQVQ